MDNSARSKSRRFRSLVTISAILSFGFASTTFSVGYGESLSNSRPDSGLTKQATFSMY